MRTFLARHGIELFLLAVCLGLAAQIYWQAQIIENERRLIVWYMHLSIGFIPPALLKGRCA